jgi:hypothetical protein
VNEAIDGTDLIRKETGSLKQEPPKHLNYLSLS